VLIALDRIKQFLFQGHPLSALLDPASRQSYELICWGRHWSRPDTTRLCRQCL
jgi:hypothetical protein